MIVEPRGGYRSTSVTKRRTREDFAKEMNRVVHLARYKNATTIHIVLDNLNTHNEKSLTLLFGKEKTDNIMKRVKFHHTPKHASWLNMAEIELSVMERQCIKKRIATRTHLVRELASWEERRNENREMINGKFTIEDAKKVFKYEGQN
jgi:transposase